MELAEDAYASLKHAVAAAKKGGYVFHYNAPVLIVVANRKGYGADGAPVRSELARTGNPVTWA